MRFELQIALRYLRARRREHFISVTTLFTAIGVTLGVAALTITLAVMSGFEASLRERILTLTPQIEIQSLAGPLTAYRQIAAKAESVRGVSGSDPFIIGQAMVSSGRAVAGVVVRGVEPGNALVEGGIGRFVRQGSLSELAKPPTGQGAHGPAAIAGNVAIGRELAARLEIGLGAQVTVIAPIITGNQLGTRSARFRVGAVFDSGMAYIDGNMVFMDLAVAQQFFGRSNAVDGVELHLQNLDRTQSVAQALRARLGSSYLVRSWEEFNRAAASGFAMLKLVYSIVLTLLIAVAAFNLVATLIMVVMEKRRDVAVLRAMGATPRAIRLIFALKGLLVGTAGTALGVTLGALGCFALARYRFIRIPKEIYGISALPVHPSALNFTAVAAASILLCLLATIYPARQAATQPPTDALRS